MPGPDEQPPSSPPTDAGGERLTHTAGTVARAYATVVVKLRFPIVAAWAVAAALAAVHMPSFGAANGGVVQLVPANAPALAALRQETRIFRVPAGSEFVLVERNPLGLPATAQERITRQAARVDRSHFGLRFALPVLNTGGAFPGSREPGTTAVTYLYPNPALPLAEQNQQAEHYAATARSHSDDVVGLTGAVPGQLRQGTLIDSHLQVTELATLAAIALIVLLAYRSIGAPLVAMAGIAVGFPVNVWMLGQLRDRYGLAIPDELAPVILALLLGILTDYAIFLLSGVRNRLAAGDDRLTATRVTVAEFAPIVTTSAAILAGSLLALLVSTLAAFRDLGPALAVTVTLGLVVAITLIPALLAIFGGLVYWPSGVGTGAGGTDGRPALSGRLLARRAVAVPVVGLCLAGLLLAAIQLGSLRLGLGQVGDLPSSSTPRVAARAAGQGFPPGILSPTAVILRAPGVATVHRGSLERLQSQVDRAPGVAATLGPRQVPRRSGLDVFSGDGGNAARIVAVLNSDPLGATAIAELGSLESSLPRMAASAGLPGVRISYAGDTALARDAVSDIRRNLWRVTGLVLLVNWVLLMLFLRSLTAPLLLIASSVAAVAAALGLTTWVFQTLLGDGQLTYYVPLVAAVLLIALGSDYNVFVVGRIWQEARIRPLRQAIAVAAPASSRTIRTAGVALAASFGILAVIPVRAFRELAFAMVAGILLETFVVRSLLVPSLITIFGYASGWPGGRRRRGRDTAPAE
jgi:putative drug exporter of the RND superfamily